MKRVKEIREKQSDGSFNNNSVPIGTDGELVDMLSGLDNEQELKLGGNHTAEIVEVSSSETEVSETYFDLSQNANYTVDTNIQDQNDGSTVIVSTLKKNGVTVKVKTITISEDGNETAVEEVLS